ncbi:gustatory receptor 8a-like [Episyrphus balteatus]|uniref:gustatory receptor 8a-like n=1 Tax=Episyrphus balteatus TaxID=286459 RepID=UPI0024867334|nr:gustatory receptor 8a-like [Episyrphus balteatus]
MPSTMENFWVMFQPFYYMGIIRNTQFVLYMDLIRNEIEFLDLELSVLVEFTCWEKPNRSFPQFNEFIRRRIVEQQKVYGTIFEMSQSFQTACNWSMVMHLFRGYTRVVVDSYFAIWSFMAKTDPIDRNMTALQF